MLRPLKIGHLSACCCSNFVSRMRYVNRLKEDDELCAAALQNGHMFLFHRLSPLLQLTQQGTLRPATLNLSTISIEPQTCSRSWRLGSDRTLLKESVLIGCSEQNQVQFCLDVGELDQASVEELCGGTFINLRKAFFLLMGAEAPLVAKVSGPDLVLVPSFRVRLCYAGIKPVASAAPQENRPTGTRQEVSESAAGPVSSTTPRYHCRPEPDPNQP
ncbi:NAD(P)H pyrophosphatase NUDT13, mitochondrial isoform X1 [Anarhichas minor]|uniref:NAD(P)H pyrophosphatase NUDT13, mitochondrial isoform X1 n=1 Tax=Anarhichas minor TaxID=65739 RepID=UPI003F732D35